MALDDATAAYLAEVRRIRPKPLTELTPEQAREQTAAARRAAAARAGDGAGARHVRVKAAGGAIPVRVLVPAEQPHGVIVYYHGGGWVLGGVDDSDALGRHSGAAHRMHGGPGRLPAGARVPLPDRGRGLLGGAVLGRGAPVATWPARARR